MTEAEWARCEVPNPMLEFLCRRRRKARERKLTLFACACCRRIWHLLPTEGCRLAVEVAERRADGLAPQQELAAAREAAFVSAREAGIELDCSYDSSLSSIPGAFAFRAAAGTVAEAISPQDVASDARKEAIYDAMRLRSGYAARWLAEEEAVAAEAAAQSGFLRDVFGNPFRPPRFEPQWRKRNVVNLASAIFDDRAFDLLPILADALEDAGCSDGTLLEHLRGPGPHVRGCFALDLVLSRK